MCCDSFGFWLNRKNSFRKKSYLKKKTVLKGFIFFSLTLFFMSKALAVESGELFWEVKKPDEETASNYLIGTKHDVMLDENSLPLEVVRALENSQVGLFEIISSELKAGRNQKEGMEKVIWLPDGETLSLYIGEEKLQKIFSSFQFAFSQLPDEIKVFLSDQWKRFGLDITSPRDFNSLKPAKILALARHLEKLKGEEGENLLNHLRDRKKFQAKRRKSRKPTSQPSIVDLSQVKEEDQSSSHVKKNNLVSSDFISAMATCFSQEKKIDQYLEKVLSCRGKPVYSLETIKGQKTVFSPDNYNKITAELLAQHSDQISALLEGRQLSEVESLTYVWDLFLSKIKENLQNYLMNGYYQNIAVDKIILKTHVEAGISTFLTENQCSSLPETSINQYGDQLIDFFSLYNERLVEGKLIEGEKKEQLIQLLKESEKSQRDIFSLCFSNYQWSDNGEEQFERRAQLQLDLLNKWIESALLSVDQKQARGMLPYFEQGAAFAAVGFSHLSGVLEELQAQGYEVRLIEFSSPLSPVEDSLELEIHQKIGITVI